MAPELFHSLEVAELREIAARFKAYQEANGLSDAALLRLFPDLGAERTYNRILNHDLKEVDLDRQNGALPALVAEDVRRGRLIAAAPELLEALLAIVTECADPGSPFYSPEPPFGADSYLPREFVDRAEAALAKALGKEVRK